MILHRATRAAAIAGLALGALLSTAPRSAATTVIARTLAEEAREADQCMEATVALATARSERGAIWTTYTLDVTDWIKAGPAGTLPRVEIRQPGGTVDGITMQVVGVPHFAVGERLVLFTKDYGGGFQSVANLAQGALRITTEATVLPGGQVTEHRVVSDAPATFVDAASSDLVEFKRRVRALVDGNAP